ncbi:MAG TPA: endonuclease/exonuclease/phosphatase family protein [Myxococcales bacterium]|jgi:endonuclease/exonuclease/phosphatase family metal-dependent hydrolase|nr:endonuclease/exonuclease/phosphatase family protein [Myxococcales bacterium]
MRLRILSYNVRYFGHALRGLASTRTGKRDIATCIARLEEVPHVICLQEVETISLRSRLVYRGAHEAETQLESFMGELERSFDEEGRPFHYAAWYFRAHVNQLRNLPLSSMGLAVLVDESALSVDTHNAQAPERITHHHVRRFRDRKQNRICAHLALRTKDGRPLHVFNTHLSLPTPFSRAFWSGKEKMGHGVNQLHEARTLASFVKRLAGDEPFVVAGDFNSPPSSPVYDYLTREAGLVGAQAALGQIDETSPRAFPTAGFLRLRMHLDHLFAGGGIRFLDVEGTAPFGDARNPFAGKSDHVPLIARLRLPETRIGPRRGGRP